MAIGTYDPDYPDESNEKVRPAYTIPKNDFAERALASCRRKYFKDKREYTQWKFIEAKTHGENEEDLLYKSWIEHAITYYSGTVNARSNVGSFDKFMSYVSNDEKRIDWIAKNRIRVLKNRKSIGKTDFEDLINKVK